MRLRRLASRTLLRIAIMTPKDDVGVFSNVEYAAVAKKMFAMARTPGKSRIVGKHPALGAPYGQKQP